MQTNQKHNSSSIIRLKANLPTGEYVQWVKLPVRETLIPQRVMISHPVLTDGKWFLSLPEMIVPMGGKRCEIDHQTVQGWREEDGVWSYPPNALSSNGLYPGTVSATIRSKADTVIFDLSMTNQDDKPWANTMAWLCFNHHAAKAYYRAETFLRTTQGWEPTRLVAEYNSFAVRERLFSWFTDASQTAEHGIIATRVEEQGQPYVIAIAAQGAVMLGQTTVWPCTDIGIGFGDLKPGETVTRRGRLYFLPGDLEDLWKIYQQDFDLRVA